MNSLEMEINELYEDCENGAADDIVCGWNKALDAVLEIVRNSDDMILERASETAMMFVDDDRLIDADKARFVRNLGKVAAMTRDGVKGMNLDDSNTVSVNFKDGFHKVNIHMDSYAAIMKDCSKAIN